MTQNMLKRLFQTTALLRRFKARQALRLPWFILLGLGRRIKDNIDHRARSVGTGIVVCPAGIGSSAKPSI